MKVLITGAAGYIGSKLTSKLFSLGLKLTCLDNLMFGQNNSFILNNKNINFIKGDVRDKNLIKSIVKKFDLIIPLAAIVGAPLCSKMPKETEEINFESIKYLVQNLSKNQIVIMPVTNSGYGIGDPEKFCDEDTPLKPISLYGITKVKAEKIIMERENSISFRLATVFGVSERMRIDLMVNNFVYIAIKEKYFKLYEPHFRRNYIHIEDVVSGFHFAINNFNNLKNNIYNLGLSEANLTKEDLCKNMTEFFESDVAKDYDVCMLSYNLHESRECPDTPFLKQVLFAQTASGYIIHSRYYDTLIQLYELAIPLLERTGQHWIYANDIVWSDLQKKDKWYCFSQRLGKQLPGFSDNAGCEIVYDC